MDYLEYLATAPGNLILKGDFNIHINDQSDSNAKGFLRLLIIFGLVQHVVGPTHISGNTLYLLITRPSEDIVSQVYTCNPMISHHHAIVFKVTSEKLPFERKIISYRKLKTIDKITFNEDIYYTLDSSQIGKLL